jgi:ferritin
VFLYKFVEEQVEEENLFRDIVQLLEYAGESLHAVLMLDSRLGQRK